MEKSLPNDKELEVLTLFYNRFYDLYEEITNDNFFKENAQLRFFKLREAFSIYKELLSYEPIKSYLEWMKRGGKNAFDVNYSNYLNHSSSNGISNSHVIR